MASNGKIVCVTGASGNLASWLVKLLLNRGYTVKASFRNPADRKKIERLHTLDGAKERLWLFKANLLDEGSFDSVVDGCEGVFHTTSPVYHAFTGSEVKLTEPAVKGTLNVLGSCKKIPSVKRVVVTSSMRAAPYNRKPRTRDLLIEKFWSGRSNMLTEEAAWGYAEENGIDMVTINPAMAIGPLLQPTLDRSYATILNLINGTWDYPFTFFGCVNVQDVAKAHIIAHEDSSASGTYHLAESYATYSKLLKILKELYPSIPFSDKYESIIRFVDRQLTGSSRCYKEEEESLHAKYKAESLGIKYIPLKTSLKETVESLKEKGFVSF